MLKSPDAPAVSVLNTWILTSWVEFTRVLQEPEYEEAIAYYDHGYMRLEMSPLGSGHAQDNTIVGIVVNLYAALRNIEIRGFVNGSFRKQQVQECQPDLAFYIGSNLVLPPHNNEPVDLAQYAAPNLVIEIAASSLNDDLGFKRLLYERISAQEYWVVNVASAKVIGFSIDDRRSGEISISQVLPGLELKLVEEALERSKSEDDGAITRWLLQALT